MADQLVGKLDLNDLLIQWIDEGVIEPVPNKKELHPDAHVELEDLKKLLFAFRLDDPHGKGWMGPYEIQNGEMPDQLEPPESFQGFQKKLSDDEKEEIRLASEIMTAIANLPQLREANPEVFNALRQLYRLAEMRILNLVKSKIDLEKFKPENRLVLYALRGARIFKALGIKAKYHIEIDMKRLRMEDNSFMVGVGEQFAEIYNIADKESIEDVFLPDDCIASGMSEGAMLDMLYLAGFRPKRIVISAAVGVGGGMWYLQRKAKALFGDNCELVLAVGVECPAVDIDLYLKKAIDAYMVGDMGLFNKIMDEIELLEVPDGQRPIMREDVISIVEELEFLNLTDDNEVVQKIESLINRLFHQLVEA